MAREGLQHDLAEVTPANVAARTDGGQAQIVPIGQGEVDDYKTIFANAQIAGMKHFAGKSTYEAAAWGDSVATAGVSYKNLVKLLS